MKESRWPYVAAMLDGEGTICISYRTDIAHNGVQIFIYNTSIKLMKWLLGNFGGRFRPRSKTTLSKKLQYLWYPSGRANRTRFLLGVLPYLVIKVEQAKLALQYFELGYGESVKREELSKRCSLLNNQEESPEANTSDNSWSDFPPMEEFVKAGLQEKPTEEMKALAKDLGYEDRVRPA
jgi:hypothetical protein